MARTQFIDHNGKQVLFMDFSDVKIVADIVPAIEEVKRVIAQQPPASLLLLGDFADMPFDSASAQALRDFAVHNTPYLKASALIGVEGLRTLVVQTAAKSAGRALNTFDSKSEALDWLTEQSD